MDLFEVLFILVFILIPILEQARKKKQQGQGPGQGPGQAPGTRRPRVETGGSGRPQRAEPPTSASDMVPDDLWAVLTGESRPRRDEPAANEAEGPWSRAPETQPSPTAEPVSRRWDADIEHEPWEERPGMVVWDVTAPAEPEPASLEYQGSEAVSLERTDYAPVSLERTDYAPVSLERPIPPSRIRHQAFHDVIDRPPPARRRRSTPVARALKDPERLRNAIVLAEVLGPPRGLERP